MPPMEEIRNPEQVEPPNRIRSELANGERPRLTIAEKRQPRNAHLRIWGIAANERQLGGPDPRMRRG
jgi:hypothetical protein